MKIVSVRGVSIDILEFYNATKTYEMSAEEVLIIYPSPVGRGVHVPNDVRPRHRSVPGVRL